MVGWCLCQVDMSASKPLSKMAVICAFCELSCPNWKNLEIQFEKLHPNEKILTKGQNVLASTKVRKVSTDDSFERDSGKVSLETNLCASLPGPSINTVKSVETESSTPTSQDILSQMQSLLDKLKLESSGRNNQSVTDDCVSTNVIKRKVRL